MSVSAATLRKLIDAGLSGDALVDVVESIEVDHSKPQRSAAAERQARYRARMQGHLTKEDKTAILERDGYACVYCGTEDLPLHVDHILPVSRGGHNGEDNLCAACYFCNCSKGNKTPEEWGGRS